MGWTVFTRLKDSPRVVIVGFTSWTTAQKEFEFNFDGAAFHEKGFGGQNPVDNIPCAWKYMVGGTPSLKLSHEFSLLECMMNDDVLVLWGDEPQRTIVMVNGSPTLSDL